MKAFLKVGSFLLGTTLVLGAASLFVAQTFFANAGAELSKTQSDGLLVMSLAGVASITAAIIMEFN